MASLNYLQPFINAINEKAERLDVPTPIIDTLRETLASTSITEPSTKSSL